MDVKSAIYHYCDYQERCHTEVKHKLYALGCNSTEVAQYMAELIETGLLNEERYACAYTRGKFRVLHWGRQKIIQQLKANNISAYCIKKAMKEIDGEEYEKMLKGLAERKWQELRKERSIITRKGKVYRYLVQKGYEREMVTDILNEYKQN
jgi:regulatory protein